MTKKIAAIWAEDKNGLIGLDDHLPWHLPAELQHFKETTLNQVILMGRKTFDGMQRRVLPHRVTIVLTSNQLFTSDDVVVLHSREETLRWYESQDKDLYIIGGREIFKLFANDITEFYQTVVDGEFIGNIYMPEISSFVNTKKISSVVHFADEKNPCAFTVNHYVRNLNV